ncbi:hypothetical protein DFQ30_010236 [Apophysomyces sp. BC1015]|nr:hypothetical protein DFQ30_010236 [Apophysomyces sp. BC1015]
MDESVTPSLTDCHVNKPNIMNPNTPCRDPPDHPARFIRSQPFEPQQLSVTVPDILPKPSHNPTPNTVNIPRTKRTRAKRSCDLCRKKKTRCDADVSKPCTTCKNANTDCQFLVEQKKRGPATGYVEALETRLKRMEKMIETMTKNKDIDLLSDASYESEEEEEEENRGEPSFCEDSMVLCSIIGPNTLNADEDRSELSQQLNALTITDFERTRYLGSSSGIHMLDQELFSSNKRHRLPDQPSWIFQKLNTDEDEHIIMKAEEIRRPRLISAQNTLPERFAVFDDIPHITPELADCLIHRYFAQVHPYCPIINKITFLEQYYFHNPNPPDEYLLYAVCSVGARFLSVDFDPHMESISNISSSTVMWLRMEFRRKAKKILEVVYKRSKISTIQTLMLLTMFVDASEHETEDTAHWFTTGMAIRMAQDLGLHRSSLGWCLPEHERELRRRIWFSAYIMDRWVAAELGRPVTIVDHEFDVELPSPFEVSSTHRSTSQDCDSSTGQFTPSLILEAEAAIREKRPIYTCFINLVTLSQILGQVLLGLHSPKTKYTGRRNVGLVNFLDKNLRNWKANLPRELQIEYINDFASQAVHMSYNCVLLLLYRQFITNDASEDINFAFQSLGTCTTAAVALVTTPSFFANVMYSSIFQAAIVFLHNAKSDNPHVREDGQRYLSRCAELFRKDPQLNASRIANILKSLSKKFDVPIVNEVDTPEETTHDEGADRRRKRDTNYPHVDQEPEEPAAKHAKNMDNNLMGALCKAKTLSSTRPEDMYLASLTLGLGRTSTTCTTPTVSPSPSGGFDPGISLPTPSVETPLEYNLFDTQPYANSGGVQFDMASLSSEIPLWDVPSGVTWSEWDSFLRGNVDNVSM